MATDPLDALTDLIGRLSPPERHRLAAALENIADAGVAWDRFPPAVDPELAWTGY